MADNSLFSRAVRDHRERNGGPDRETTVATAEPDEARAPDEQTVGAGTYAAQQSETVQAIDEDSWLNVSEYGIPRGPEAWEAHQLGQTAPMEIVKNTVIDQITGGDIDFASDEDEELSTDAQALCDVFRAVLEGPHLMGDDFDDLVTAATSDMLEGGHGYWEALPAKNAESEFPVFALKPVDWLTIQHNVDEHGNWEEPAYYQAPYQSFAGGTIGMSDIEPTELDKKQIVSFRWHGSRRSDSVYARSPAMQVKQWLELLKNNTTHIGRFYNDNEIPAGVLSVLESNQTDVDEIEGKIEDASGDPRKAPVVGSEAKWIDVGGDALNLDVIEEQKWFLDLVWGALGINRQELGMVEDVNRSTAEEQAQIIYKRVTLPLTKTITQAVNRQIFTRFDAYESLDRPFEFALNHADPVREQHRLERISKRWQNGSLSFAEQAQRRGEEPGDTEVALPNGETFDYGPHPKHIGEILINAYRQDGSSQNDVEDVSSEDDEDTENE